MKRPPKLCHHRGAEQGYVTVNGKPKYLGKWPRSRKSPPAAVVEAYETWRAEWLAQHPPETSEPVSRSPTIREVWERYATYCDGYYRKDNRPTSEVQVIRDACKVVARLFLETHARDFNTRCLKRVRAEFVRLGWSRRNINNQISRVRGMFRWAAEEELIPETVVTGLRVLRPLRKGRSEAPERKRKRRVQLDLVAETFSHLPDVARRMVLVNYLLGCRPEEVVEMRPCDLQQQGDDLLYFPPTWKTEHLDEGEDDDELTRTVYWVGPVARFILSPLLEACPTSDSYVFSTRGVRSRRLDAADHYTTASYRRLIARTCAAKGIPRWSPSQLKHTRLTDIRQHYRSIEHAQAVARHRRIGTTQHYADRSLELARKVMREIG